MGPEEFPAGAAPDGEVVLKYFDSYFPVRPGTFASLEDDPVEVYNQQPYKLMFWRDGVISYRRFFSVNGLAGIRQEDDAVFDHTHRALRQLIDEDLIDGIRVDHPDGLTDPFGYLTRLRTLIGQDRWLVIEKILAVNEPLDPRLNIDGTTGYDALRELDGIFINPAAEDSLSMLALQQSGSAWDEAAIEAAEHQLKREVARNELGAELKRLVRAMRRDNFSTAGQDVSEDDLADTMVELVASMPVYRADYRSLSRITSAVVAEMARKQPARRDALDLIAAAMLAEGEAKTRFAQVCGAVMAKGVEDTLFYRANRLVSLQEVGGAPGRFGVGAAEFHLLQQERTQLWPHAMTALTTHDTKRTEDTRARIGEIAEVADEYAELTRQVFAIVAPPDTATGHFLLQNIVGVWPADGEVTESLRERLHEYAIKSVREAGVNTSWFDQEPEYETAVRDWIDAVLLGPVAGPISEFAARLHRGAVAVSLGRKLLQIAGPGIPDTYQGQEYIDLSLVDPDNRRFVDYTARAQTLAQYCERDGEQSITDYLEGDLLGAGASLAKQIVVSEGLNARREHPEIFLEGSYQAVFAVGEAKDHLVGIARGDHAIALATRLPLALETRGGWGETTVQLPDGTWRDRLTGRTFSGTAAVADVFAELPCALLMKSDEQ